MQPSGSHLQSLGTILDALPQALLLADSQGTVCFRNALARQVLLAGQTVQDILDKPGLPSLDWPARLKKLSQTGGDVDVPDVLLPGNAGREITADVHLALLGRIQPQTDAQRPPDVLIAISDVSNRASMERRLMISERMAAIGELAAKVAHELNNPLDGVMRYVGMAQRVAGPDAQEYLQGARVGLERMADIVRGLLEQGRAGTIARPATLDKLLDDAVTAMQPAAQAAAVAVICDLADCPRGSFSVNLFQVFCNVIKNAIDAMADSKAIGRNASVGKLLTIRQRLAAGRVTIEFADTGSGIAPADLEKIFQPFFTTKAAGKGTGLGLAICREIVGRLGGSIAVANRPEGGAVISISLPVPTQRQ